MSFDDYFIIFSLIALSIAILAWIIRFFEILLNNNIRIVKIYQIIGIFIIPIIPTIYYGLKLLFKIFIWEAKGAKQRLKKFNSILISIIKFLFGKSK